MPSRRRRTARHERDVRAPAAPPPDPSSELARSWSATGSPTGSVATIADPRIGAVVARAEGQSFYLRVLAGVCEATIGSVRRLAETTMYLEGLMPSGPASS
ncbi:hypothetical protein BST11_22445 [Mycobacterium alsense]|uniref:Uncharacterized protein n=1 Tax=Mycobacterium alsense TaxID=324058 RepID=A0AA41XTU4_9MYCO|nr:hypothetical protein [Mycobacterium alsense]MCV7381886.1 hypothetical protein [Mycobacterium alsense]OQZ88504.1 hypothetical protein BST11_22445 [Mycobacterium alsense]